MVIEGCTQFCSKKFYYIEFQTKMFNRFYAFFKGSVAQYMLFIYVVQTFVFCLLHNSLF